jgi:hypothetical protein
MPPLRWIAVSAFVGLVAVTTGMELAHPERMTVEIGPALPVADPEDWGNTLGNRYWGIDPTVAVRLERECSDVHLSVRARALSNGRPVPAWDANLGPGGAEAQGPHRVGFVLRSPEEAYGIAGYGVRFEAVATCRHRGSEHRAAATRTFQLPAASCDGGPLRVYDISGEAEVTDDDWDARDTYRLRVGQHVRPGWGINVPPQGHVVIGAPECNGYSVKLGPGRHFAGGYDSQARGDAFFGPGAEMTGDAHAGGYRTKGGTIEPLGFRCRDCPTPIPATFAARMVSRTRTVVRVSRGRARVAVGLGRGRGVRLRAGQQVSIVCRSLSRCATDGLRIYQPDEPWDSPTAGAAGFVGRVATAAGRRPRVDQLVPPRSQGRVAVLPAGSTVPEQIFASWSRTVRRSATVHELEEQGQEGVLLWQRAEDTRRAVWRLVYRTRVPPSGSVVFDTGDISGDGHPEVIFAMLQGSGACGTWRLLVTTSSGVREALRDQNCETYHELSDGALHLREPVGPCPYSDRAAHCYGGTRDRQLRWDGRKLVEVRTVVRCVLPRLDPARGCG